MQPTTGNTWRETALSVTFRLDPTLAALATALGLLDADGGVRPEWFSHPLDALGTVLTDPVQRAALGTLLDVALPPTQDGPPGEHWHPLLVGETEDDAERGQVFLVVTGTTIGVAARIATSADATRGVRASLRLDLVATDGGAVRAVAGTAEAPLRATVDAWWDAPAAPSGLGIEVAVDTENALAVRVTLTDLDLGAGPAPTTVLDPAALGTDAVRALLGLVREHLAGTDAGPVVARVVDHLPGLLGLDGVLPPLPADRLVSDPAAFGRWLAAIVATPEMARAWFVHLAGVLGAGLPDAGPDPGPAVSGAGAPNDPLRAVLAAPADGVGLEVTLAVGRDPAGGVPVLLPGLRLAVATGAATLEGAATLLAVPVGGQARATVLPAAHLRLLTAQEPLVRLDQTAAGEARFGVRSLAAGVAWNGAALTPSLELHDVVLGEHTSDRLDLTDAESIVAAITGGLGDLLGGGEIADALRTLIGPVALPDLLTAPTRAIGEAHRAVLAAPPPTAGWAPMLASLGVLVGLPGAVTGAGIAEDPWRLTLTIEDPAVLALAAWNARGPGDPPGTERLRIGLLLDVETEAELPARFTWCSELLATDLPVDGAAHARLFAGHHMTLRLGPLPGAPTALGTTISAGALVLAVDAVPGAPVDWRARVEDLRIDNGVGGVVGPATIALPGDSDPAFGLDPEAAAALLRTLATHALASWSDGSAFVLGALLGLHRRLPGLPPDWPLLEPPDPVDVASLAAAPLDALRAHLARLARGTSAGGTTFAASALVWLQALLTERLPADGGRPHLPITGSGTPHGPAAPTGRAGAGTGPGGTSTSSAGERPRWGDPWVLRLGADAPGPTLDALVWLGPDGPLAPHRAAALAALRAAPDAAGLLGAFAALTDAVGGAADVLRGRDATDSDGGLADLAAGLDALDERLAAGDGLVPLASQLAVGPTWRTGELQCAHADQPADPEAIATIARQLAEWTGPGAPRAVLLVAPPSADHRVWEPLLAVLEPGRAPDAHLDLRAPGIDPATVDLAQLDARAAHYTVDLADRAGHAVTDLADQLERAAHRVVELTGQPQVFLVGHGAAGVTARVCAARSTVVAGVITLGAPHAGAPGLDAAGPWASPGPAGTAWADAARAAAALVALLDDASRPDGGTPPDPVLRALAGLAEALDGAPAAPRPGELAGAPEGLLDTVPGLALGSRAGNVIRSLGTALADRAADQAERADPTHLGLGVRAVLCAPEPDADGVAVGVTVRADAAPLPLVPGAPPGPGARVQILATVERPGGWLLGGPAGADEAGVRVRWVELGAVIESGAGGAAGVRPVLRLHEATRAGVTAAVVELADLAAWLPATPGRVPLAAEWPATGSASALLIAALEALGVVVDDGDGGSALALDALAALATAPAAHLGPRAGALMDAVASLVGAQGPAGGPWTLRPTGLPVAIVVTRDPWTLRVRTESDLPLGDLALGLDAVLALPALTGSAEVTVALGDTRFTWSGAAGTLTLHGGPWPDPVALWSASGPPPPEALGRALLVPLPRTMLSAATTVVLESRLPLGMRVPPLHGLLDAPGKWLARPEVLGSPDHPGLDPAKVVALLDAAATALGLPVDPAGLRLPGGLTVRAEGEDPLRVTLTGPVAPGSGLTLGAGVIVDRSGVVAPAGSLALTVPLDGAGRWDAVGIDLAVDPTGVAAAVTFGPDAPAPVRITLLPALAGDLESVLGGLATEAVALLPRVLQRTVSALRPDGAPSAGVLAASLRVAEALGIWADDAAGFERPERAARLAALLDPAWWSDTAAIAGTVITRAGELFGPLPLLAPSVGAMEAASTMVVWRHEPPGGPELRVIAGWDASGVAPTLELVVSGVTLGPVRLGEIRVAYAGGPSARLMLGLDPPAPLGFLTPALALGTGPDGSVAVAVLPLGPGRDDVRVRLAPEPAVDLGPDGALALVEAWAVPLATTVLLRAFADDVDTALWTDTEGTDGPDTRAVLEAAELIVDDGAVPPRLAEALPALPAAIPRALAALATGVRVDLDNGLSLGLVRDAGRTGLRLDGVVALPGGAATVRFGDPAWPGDTPGLTLWLVEDVPTIALRPGLRLEGVGVTFASAGGAPLSDGVLRIEALTALLFTSADLVDAGGAPRLAVTDTGAAVGVRGAQLRLASGDGDSFVQKVLPPQLAAPFDLAVGWRPSTGLVVLGGDEGIGVTMTIPLDVDLVVARLVELFLGLGVQSEVVTLDAGLSGDVELGPISGSVERLGVRAVLRPGGAELRFLPPRTVSLAIEAGPVSGSGFLHVDEAKGEYGGGLSLRMGSIAFTAIGLLSTRWPDGSPIRGADGTPGFSLLVIVTAELPAIQLGFGFTLLGLGGLLGLNRTMNLPALRDGARTRALDSMLFPPTPLDGAAIVSTLSTVFPAAPGRFLVAPMVRLGWGTPTILTLDLAVLLELPAPVRLAVLGRMRLALPPEVEPAIVLINLDVVGTLDLGRGEVSLDATIYDSTVAGFALSGQMALRVRWGADPEFALAVGGFHPAFTPPPDFPALERVTLSLATGDNPRLRLETYLAVTSNTIQFGAAVDLHAEALGFAVDGHLAFDALLQLVPFGIRVGFGAMVALRRIGDDTVLAGIDVRVDLTGPGPWHVWGFATITLLIFEVEVAFDEVIGDPAPPALPPPARVDVLMLAAVKDPASWTATPPTGQAVVRLRTDGTDGAGRTGVLRLHPLGGLTFRERVAPLDQDLEVYGTATLEGPRRFGITAVELNGVLVPTTEWSSVSDAFATAQFRVLSDAEKLSRPSFESYHSGVTVTPLKPDLDESGAGEATAFGYRVVVVTETEDGDAKDGEGHEPVRYPDVTEDAVHAAALAPRGPAARAAARRLGAAQAPGAPVPVRVKEVVK